MNKPSRFVRTTAAALVVAIGGSSLTSCANINPGLQGLGAGLAAGLGAGLGARALGMDSRKAAILGAAAGVATAVVVAVIAKRRATQAQIAAAEARGRAYTARVNSGKAKAPKTQYVMVEAPRTSESQGKSNVMVFDTKANEVVGSNVYELNSKPSSGQVVTFDTGSAEYVSAY